MHLFPRPNQVSGLYVKTNKKGRNDESGLGVGLHLPHIADISFEVSITLQKYPDLVDCQWHNVKCVYVSVSECVCVIPVYPFQVEFRVIV